MQVYKMALQFHTFSLDKFLLSIIYYVHDNYPWSWFIVNVISGCYFNFNHAWVHDLYWQTYVRCVETTNQIDRYLRIGVIVYGS